LGHVGGADRGFGGIVVGAAQVIAVHRPVATRPGAEPGSGPSTSRNQAGGEGDSTAQDDKE
jgi:hypothetical protein